MFSEKEYSLYEGFPRKYNSIKNKMFKDWEIPPWNLHIDCSKLLGEGEFGKVYLATWHNTQVVAKVIHEDISKEKKRLFIQEIDVLTKIHHPNVVQLMGYVTDPFIIVMEYLPNGELLEYIQKHKWSLSISKKIDICLDILRALTYLHNRKPFPILHRDIKPQNIVMSPSGTAKLADFGISTIFKDNECLSRHNSLENIIEEDEGEKEFLNNKDLTGFVGSLRYMSPEVKNNEQYNSKIDIWSSGIIFAELFENIRYGKNFYWNKTPDDIRNIIITYMIRENPNHRLSADEITKLFFQLKNKYAKGCVCF